MKPDREKRMRGVWIGFLVFVVACTDGVLEVPDDAENDFFGDATTDGGSASDASTGPDLYPIDGSEFADATRLDASTIDTGPRDLGSPMDAAPADLGSPPDTGPIDAGSPADVGVIDAGAGDAVPADMQGLLALMNAARLATGSPPLTWNAGVAASAAAWAEGCTWMHAPQNERYYMGTLMGENLSAGSGSGWTPTSLGQGWVDEEANYNCSVNTCAAGEVCGHYTQIIWRNSTEVGCALRSCTSGSPLGNGNWLFLVCRYLPAGNFNGQRPIPAGDCP